MPTADCCGAFVSLHALSHACQVVAGIVEDRTAVLDGAGLAAPFRGLPAPRAEVEVLAADRLMSRFTDQLVRRLHARVHGHAADAACGFPLGHYRLDLDAACWRQPGLLERRVAEWVIRLMNGLRTTRPRSAATRAIRRLRDHRMAERTGDVAAELGCSTSVLRRRFARECGESPTRYRIRTRVARAIELLRTTDWKNEAIAREIGWRSNKDLYLQVKRATGMTPAQIRRASPETIAALIASSKVEPCALVATN